MVVHDGFDKGIDILEHTAANALLSDLSEPALYHVQPGCRGGSEVHVETRVLGQPCGHFRVSMRTVVVDDQVKIQLFWGLPIYGAQEF